MLPNPMKTFSFSLPIFWYLYLNLRLLFTLNSLWFGPNIIAASALGNDTDHLALLKFKESISSDPYGILNSWNSSNHFCNWHGITCNLMHQRVMELNLEGYNLRGSISPHVGNLSFLRNLNLVNNSFDGKIPQELARILQLVEIHLSYNFLVGEIPTNLTSCTNLKGLQLFGNRLVGKIPIEIGSLKKLEILNVAQNNLSGGVPPFLGNLSSLTILSVGANNLIGEVPQEICHLKNLTRLSVPINNLSGTFFHSCFYNISSLTIISTTLNQFNGSLPPNLFLTLPYLQICAIGGNQFLGSIPNSITNATALRFFDISHNLFTGHVPNLKNLKNLSLVNIASNHFGSGSNSTTDLKFLRSLTNCSELNVLSVSNNNFGGHLSNSLGNLSVQLTFLYLGNNKISGTIPTELGNLINLISFSVEYNHLEGIIPASFGRFQKMQYLGLTGNKLSGDIPSFIGNLSRLYRLNLAQNLLEGNIPVSIGNFQKLQYLNLSQNNLRGTIPLELFTLPSLSNILDLSQNLLSGSLSEEVGKLKNIDWLDVSENHLSGHIPATIGECLSLEYLYLQGNSFHGIIPSSLTSLKSLQHLDLSRNSLSGPIPNALQNISFLKYLNVSFNMLVGEVPTKGVFQNVSALGVIGNKLCGGISELHLPPCPVKGQKPARYHKHHKLRLIAVIVSVVACLVILSFILTIYWMRKKNKKPCIDSPTIDQLAKVSYQDLHHGTDGFSTRNLIGSGSFGSVYKGTLESEDEAVAIKVFSLQKKGANKSFIAECNALKNIRHRNLVKILTCCAGIDYKGQEFKALIFEYMKNGSLESWLHSSMDIEDQHRSLDLEQRFNIIADVASAFHYLHHECEQVILHCDLKPSNVLLDEDMVAHVSDFGLARLLSTINGTSRMETSTTGIKGTVGYAPPEYGMGSNVSTYGDMYSFGVLVLEILTGRRPTDEKFEDCQNLHNFVEISFPDNLLQILDPYLVPNEEATIEKENSEILTPTGKKCLISLFRIGLACSMESPKERMDMMDVIRELSIIRKAFVLGVNMKN